MTTELDNDTLEWAAQWIESSLKGEMSERAIDFGFNTAMTLRAAKGETSPASAAPVVDIGGFQCSCCGRNMEIRINGEFCNECAGHQSALRRVLGQIVNDLPTKRDWLDPALEQEALALTGRITAAATAAPQQSEAYPVMSGGKDAIAWQREESEQLNSGSPVDEPSRARRDSEASSVTPHSSESVSDRQGDPVPKCVKCGHDAFNGRYCEADDPAFQTRHVPCGCKCVFATAAPVEQSDTLRKRARQIIDAVIKSPIVIEVRAFSQPEAVDKLEDQIIVLLRRPLNEAAR